MCDIAATLYTCIREISGSNLGRFTGCRERGLSSFFPFSPGEFRNNSLKQATTASLQLLTYSPFMIVFVSFSTLYNVCSRIASINNIRSSSVRNIRSVYCIVWSLRVAQLRPIVPLAIFLSEEKLFVNHCAARWD
jgi:hypothetical protein